MLKVAACFTAELKRYYFVDSASHTRYLAEFTQVFTGSFERPQTLRSDPQGLLSQSKARYMAMIYGTRLIRMLKIAAAY